MWSTQPWPSQIGMAELKEPRQEYETQAVQPRLVTDSALGVEALHRDRDKTGKRKARPLASSVDLVGWVTDGRYDGKTFKLFDDVSQVYELTLARMEFLSLGHDLAALRRRSAYFEEIDGEKSDHYYFSSVRGKGQIGHSNQYLTHWFYPYKGKYHGQMIKALINFMGVGGSGLVLDPFVGSGTTLVECATLGIPSIGIDINPALCIVSQIKVDSLSTRYPDFHTVLSQAKPLDIFDYFNSHREIALKRKWQIDRLNLDAKALLADAWQNQFKDGFVKDLPETWRNLLFLCYLHALSDHTYLQGTPKAMRFEEFFIRDLNEYLDTLSGTYRVLLDRHVNPKQPKVILGSALDVPLPEESVDGIVTSPPYSIALDYVKNDQHLLDYLSIDTGRLREQILGLRGRNEEKIRLYRADMKRSLEEMHRVLKPDCYAAILLGDVVVGSLRTSFAKEIIAWAPAMGFSEAELIRRPILGGYARLRYEYMIVLRK